MQIYKLRENECCEPDTHRHIHGLIPWSQHLRYLIPITFPYKKLTKKHWWIHHLSGKRASFRASLRHGLNNHLLVWLISSANFQIDTVIHFTPPKFWKMFENPKKCSKGIFYAHCHGDFGKLFEACATKRHSPPRLVPGTSGWACCRNLWRTVFKTCRAYEKPISHCTHFLEGQTVKSRIIQVD